METSLVYLKNRKEEVCIRLEGDRGKREEVWGWGRVSRQPREPRREGCRVCSSRSGSLSISTLGSSGVQTTLPLLSGHVCTSLLSLQGLQSNLSSSITTRAHGFLLSPSTYRHSFIHPFTYLFTHPSNIDLSQVFCPCCFLCLEHCLLSLMALLPPLTFLRPLF